MKIGTAVLALVCVGSSALAASDSDGPVLFRGHNTLVIAKAGNTAISHRDGYTPLDKPRSFKCRSAAGCIVIVNATILAAGEQGHAGACPLVDGTEAAPPCAFPNDVLQPLFAHSMASVGQGTHTVQTTIKATSTGLVTHWEADYTIYERPAKGTN